MTKTTKYFDLFSALKAGGDKGVSPESLRKTLRFSYSALAVYIHTLRHKFGAEIESNRNGRSIVSYRLVNVTEMEKTIQPNRVSKKKKAKTAKKKKVVTVQNVVKQSKKNQNTVKNNDEMIPVLDSDATDYTEISSSELDDIRHSLGI